MRAWLVGGFVVCLFSKRGGLEAVQNTWCGAVQKSHMRGKDLHRCSHSTATVETSLVCEGLLSSCQPRRNSAYTS